MKKILFSIIILSCIPVHAISIKEKIKNLRKSLAVHAESENKSWNLLEDIDKRVNRLEHEYNSYPEMITEEEIIKTDTPKPQKLSNKPQAELTPNPTHSNKAPSESSKLDTVKSNNEPMTSPRAQPTGCTLCTSDLEKPPISSKPSTHCKMCSPIQMSERSRMMPSMGCKFCDSDIPQKIVKTEHPQSMGCPFCTSELFSQNTPQQNEHIAGKPSTHCKMCSPIQMSERSRMMPSMGCKFCDSDIPQKIVKTEHPQSMGCTFCTSELFSQNTQQQNELEKPKKRKKRSHMPNV